MLADRLRALKQGRRWLWLQARAERAFQPRVGHADCELGLDPRVRRATGRQQRVLLVRIRLSVVCADIVCADRDTTTCVNAGFPANITTTGIQSIACSFYCW